MQAGLVGILHCFVVSEPMATLVLSHGGLVRASTSGKDDRGPRFSVSSAPNFLRLEIRDLGLADSGEYTCTATNSYGNASSTLDFQANGKMAMGLVEGARRGGLLWPLPPRSPEGSTEGLN